MLIYNEGQIMKHKGLHEFTLTLAGVSGAWAAMWFFEFELTGSKVIIMHIFWILTGILNYFVNFHRSSKANG